MKIEITNFSKKIAKGLNKLTPKFVMDMQYGLANLHPEEKQIIWNNYLEEVKKNVDKENAIVLFDDSDINK